MSPPPPASREGSYAYRPTRTASYAPSDARRSFEYQPVHRRRSEDNAAMRNADGMGGIDGLDGVDADDSESRSVEEEGLEALDDERGLEETSEKLGFGAYQWRLSASCGFGWMSDNSALQCIAVISPRVQIHFNSSSQIVGSLSASTMAGMMIGAVGWGTISDISGRALPFNATLFLTAVFGIGASFAPTFPILCVWMFFSGSAVGGSMPTDGTLFLENLPHSKQYSLTSLSVFFSLGAVLSSIVSYIFLPGASCRQYDGCDIAGKENDGWRKVLLVSGCFNSLCSFARWGLFRLHESPRYLVSNGRSHEAVVVLRAIASFNDTEMDIQHADVQMGQPDHISKDTELGTRDKKDSESPSPDMIAEGERSPLPRYHSESNGSTPRINYDAVGHGVPSAPRPQPIRTGSAFYAETPAGVHAELPHNHFEASFGRGEDLQEEEEEEEGAGDSAGLLRPKPSRRQTSRSGGVVPPKRKQGWFDWWFQWKRQSAKSFVPQWRRTVILMWIIWGAMSFGYTMFNVWSPAVLESRAKGEGDQAIRSALTEFVLYSVAGCPGSIVGAWMIQTRLGRRKSLAICTAATAISTFAFIKVSADWAVVVSSMIISAAATAMYAVLYGMTPETFGTSIRGTACGTSAALSRSTGVIAPISAGALLSISPSLPSFASAGVFLLTAACSSALPFERVSEGKGAVFAH